MESAIPDHLRQQRQCPATTPAHYQPPFPAWSSRFSPLTGQVVMACFGVQGRDGIALSDLAPITERFSMADGPLFWDGGECVDAQGFHTGIVIAYWADVQAFARWQQTCGFTAWWQHEARERGPLGWFMEVVCPTAERFETVFSSPDRAEGIGHLASHVSAPILEHGYWGSARDRLPIAQVDPLPGRAPASVPPPHGKRVRLPGRDNLCLIRSGQDWSDTRGEERRLYLNDVRPVLETGMTFLRDQGGDIGCLSCRFMQAVDRSGLPIDKSFGLAWFDDLAHLERWAKTHPTHVAIFGGFMNYVQTLNFQIQLRLYHEVAVIPASAQFFEYVNCHPGSGLLSR